MLTPSTRMSRLTRRVSNFLGGGDSVAMLMERGPHHFHFLSPWCGYKLFGPSCVFRLCQPPEPRELSSRARNKLKLHPPVVYTVDCTTKVKSEPTSHDSICVICVCMIWRDDRVVIRHETMPANPTSESSPQADVLCLTTASYIYGCRCFALPGGLVYSVPQKPRNATRWSQIEKRKEGGVGPAPKASQT